jgi:hypothetical protein
MFRNLSARLGESDHIWTRLLRPIPKIICPHIRASLECIPHLSPRTHHQTNMVNSFGIILAVASIAKEYCIPSAALRIWEFSKKRKLANLKQINLRISTYLYFNLLSLAQYILLVTLKPSLNRSRPVTLQTAQLTSPEQSKPS